MAIRFAILISGRGSNMLSLADALQNNQASHNTEHAPAHAGEIGLVIADNNCAGLALAKDRGLATSLVSYADLGKQAAEAQIAEAIEEAGCDYVLLAGFMRVLSPAFVQRFEGRILNIHPSLLPLYKGLDTHQRAIAACDKRHGVSVHIVTASLDEGPIIAQASLAILPEDDAQSLAMRLLPIEHALYQFVIEGLLSGHVTIKDETITWQANSALSAPSMLRDAALLLGNTA